MPEKIIDIPVEYQQQEGTLEVKHEEEALCWLWAFPSLFPWPRPIIWLYTPVVGRSRWPGDLWGIDSTGELLIVESKQCKQSDDPFTDFVKFHVRAKEKYRSAAHWLEKFSKHLEHEQDSHFSDCISERPKHRTDGILPRSNRRKHIRRWPQIAFTIEKYIRHPQYKTTALRYLQARSAAGDPIPFYFALMIVSRSRHNVLSKKLIESGLKLQKKVGAGHVGVVSVGATVLPNSQIRITTNSHNLPQGK